MVHTNRNYLVSHDDRMSERQTFVIFILLKDNFVFFFVVLYFAGFVFSTKNVATHSYRCLKSNKQNSFVFSSINYSLMCEIFATCYIPLFFT